MTDHMMGSLALVPMLLTLASAVLGQFFVKLRQPKVVGEILAGVVLGPSLLGHFAPAWPDRSSPRERRARPGRW